MIKVKEKRFKTKCKAAVILYKYLRLEIFKI